MILFFYLILNTDDPHLVPIACPTTYLRTLRQPIRANVYIAATLRIILIIECKYNRISGMEIFAPENTRRWAASQQYSTQAFTFTCSWFAMWLYLLFCRGTTAVVSSEAWPLIQWTTGERDAEETVCPVFNKLSQPMSFRFPPLEVLYERICRLCFCWGLFLLAWQPRW